MNIFENDKKSKYKFRWLQIIFILSGLFQGLCVVSTMFLFKYLFRSDFESAWQWIGYIAIGALICFVLYFIGVSIGNHMAVWAVCDAQVRRVGSALTKLPLGWFDASSKGKVSKAISTDINTISHYPPMVLPEILTVLSASGVIFIFLLWVSLKYALIMVPMSALMFYFWQRNMKALQSVEEENVRANQDMESTVVAFAQLQPVLRASGALTHGWNRLDRALKDDQDAVLRTLKKKGENMSRYMLTVNLGTILILALASFQLIQKQMPVYVFVSVILAMLRFANPLAGLLGYMVEIFNIQSALKRIQHIVEAKRLPEPKPGQEASLIGTTHKGVDIAFENVNFRYVKDRGVLKNISFYIPAGSVTALVGPSGSGKSTIHRLMARFWDVDQGQILFQGQNIKDIPTHELMNLVSMVFQEVYLFDTTIKENVAMAKPDATEAEILEAAKKARLDEVIQRLPHGWDTKVGEGGSTLSGGEKQRVSIARAFLKDAPILLLDEITSALDGVNEAIITKSLEDLSKNRTVVLIAHRLSSIQHADYIGVIEDGVMTGWGNHQSLLTQNERYQKLWQALQHGEAWQL